MATRRLRPRDYGLTARIDLRVPPHLLEAVERAARRETATPSEWLRRAIVNQAKASGIDPAKLNPIAA